MSCLDAFFAGRPDKWKSFCIFHSELQERMTDLWQAGLTISAAGYVVNSRVCQQFDTCLRIGKLPNPYKEDSTPNTVKDLPESTRYAFILAWTAVNGFDQEHMAAIQMSRNSAYTAYMDALARNLIILFRHDNPEAMTKESFAIQWP